jgi:hypothetical protein
MLPEQRRARQADGERDQDGQAGGHGEDAASSANTKHCRISSA